jgi:MATE family multidrug resistance protein
MVPLGLAIAVGMRTSAALGAGQRERLRPIWTGAALMSAAFAAVVSLAFVLVGRRIASCFISDPAVVSASASLLVVAGIFQVFDGSQVISSSALRGISDVRVPVALTFASYWLIAEPVAYLLAIRIGYGAVGAWCGLAVGLWAASVMLGFRFLRLTRATP